MKNDMRGSFDDKQKEPVIDRIASLVNRYPSRRQAAQAWEINYNTLQNYFKRADKEPIPRKAVLEKIANKEKVTIDWLLTGVGSCGAKNELIEPSNERNLSNPNALRLLDMLDFLGEDKINALIKLLTLKGVEQLTGLLDEDNLSLMQLTGEKREAALMLMQLDPIRVREILSELRASRDMARTASQQAVGDHKKDLA
ncbi:hypothetical protein ACQUWL_17395 [Serratia marcescens]|uniref:hypothetical protein n=1 Tax=Serratia marcescens TaxID=615 RepID=UPI002AD02CCD|nr:hypothetical protein [Salmonella enterica]EMB3139036.1 hypothetical protein [Salmonella enterica]EMF0013765.1 hypothetical protein [Salmonella enterica]